MLNESKSCLSSIVQGMLSGKQLICCTILVLCFNILYAQPEFSNRVDLGEIEHPGIVEASGIVASRTNDHVLWTHNDTYCFNRIFAFNEQGTHLGIFWLDGIVNRDWEDIALGPGPDPNVDYLYVGEIGDNNAVHEYKYIYRFPEPVVHFNQAPVEETIYEFDTIICQYPDGARDAETLLLDPLTKDIYIISKREFEELRVYRAPYPQPVNEVIIMEHVKTLDLWEIVGGDISVSGREILLKDYEEVYYWERDPDVNFWEAFNNDPIVLPYVQEVCGEAICWAPDSMGYYTLSEEGPQIPAHLFYYPRLDPSPVVINEIMLNPLSIGDELGEWIEIYNNSDEIIDLQNWYIQDAGTDLHIIQESLILSPEEFLVFGINDDETVNGGVIVDYQYSNFYLDNSEDEIMILSPDGVLMDSLAYADGLFFPNLEGSAMALLDANMENSCGFSWREATSPYGNGDLGSPGQDNSGEILDVKIKDIQYTEDPSGQSDLLGQRVTVSGTVSTVPWGFFECNFYIQDSLGMWSGIYVTYFSYSAAYQDSVRLTGTVVEVYGNVTAVMFVENFENFGIANTIIDPIEVTTEEISNTGENGEAYEGVLVKVSGICDNDSLGWREWSLDDGSGSTMIYHYLIDDFIPIQGEEYEVTGIQYWDWGNFRVFPRFISDIVGPSGIDEGNMITPVELTQNYPNPFNPTTTISFSIPKESHAELSIYNIKGQKVKTLVNESALSGEHTVSWNGKDESGNSVKSGLYFYKLNVNGKTEAVRKCVMMR